jgi:integrase
MARPTRDDDGLLEKKSFPFTPERLEKLCRLVRVRRGRWEWRDESCRQLIVRIGPSGGVFYRHGRDPGTKKVKKTRIGDVTGPNHIALETARKQCERLRVDPRATAALPCRRKPSGGELIGSAWPAYKAAIETGLFSMTGRRQALRASTIRVYEELYNCQLKEHESKGLRWLAANVKNIFEAIATKGAGKSKKPSPATANKFLQICRSLFEFARDKGWWTEPNPTLDPRTGKSYKKFALKKRMTTLTADQAKRLSVAMEAKGPFWCDFFTILLLTGRRLSNVRTLRWDQIDLQEGLIIDSADEMKNGCAQHTKVCKTVRDVLLRRRAEATADAKYVFPGRRAGMPIQNADHAWEAIRTAANLEHVRIHDLRHTAASWAMSAGNNQAAIGRFLSHKSPASTAQYTHANTHDTFGVGEDVEEIYLGATKV